MQIPIIIELTAIRDILDTVPAEDEDDLLDEIERRLSHNPEIGRKMDPPNAFARVHHIGRKWRIFYEPIY